MLKVNGWATLGAGTTGGKGGKVVRVNNSSDFEDAVDDDEPRIVEVQGQFPIEYCQVGKNKTIVGIGKDAKLTGTLRVEKGNVIFKNLSITNPDGDGISVAKGKNVFTTHCTIFDCSDGCHDITKQADYVTIEYTKFFYNEVAEHNLAVLIGSSDTDPDEGFLRTTIHHCFFGDNVLDRAPRVRKGKVHVYCNKFDSEEQGAEVSAIVTAAINSEVLVENNLFVSGEDAWLYYKDQNGKIKAKGNEFGPNYREDEPEGGNDTVFTPPYPYKLDNPDDLISLDEVAGVDGDSDLTEEGGGGEPVVPPVEPPVEPVEPPVPPVTGSPIKDFVLINSGTESEVSPMTEGGSYSIKKYGPKLNVKVNVTENVTRVEFELSGPMTLSTKDKGAPFSLHGDDGKGNYYYGNWNPPKKGSYKLRATPFNGDTKLTASTINFNFVA